MIQITENKTKRNYAMQSVQRAVKVLRAFVIEEKRLSLTELHEVTKIGKSSLQRLLYTLTSEGLLQRSEEDKRYQLGLDFIFFAELVKKDSSLLSTASPVMNKLNLSIKESVSLSIIEDFQRKCIFNIESKHELSALTYVGQLSPLYAGASAKVLLAHFCDDKLSEYLDTKSLEQITDNTITSKTNLIKELKDIKQKGYAISYGERVIGAVSISAPIFDPFSNIIAALTIMIPWVRIDENNMDSLINEVINGSKEITNKMKN